MSCVMVDRAGHTAGKKCAEAIKLIGEAQEAIRLLAWQNFEKRGGVNGSAEEDWARAENELFQVPVATTEQTADGFHISVDIRAYEHTTIRVMALPSEIVVMADLEKREGADSALKPLYRRIWLGPIESAKVEPRLDNHGFLILDVTRQSESVESPPATTTPPLAIAA